MKFHNSIIAAAVLMAAAGKEKSTGGKGDPNAEAPKIAGDKEAKEAKANEIATTGSRAVAMAGINFDEDAGKGVEGVDKDSQAIPFLVVLQPLSPAVADDLVPGAKPGMIMNTVTNELFESIVVVPVSFQRRMVQWAPRKKGGGYKGEHMPVEVENGDLGYKAEGGNQYFIAGEDGKQLRYLEAKDAHDMLKDTRSHFVMAVKPDGSFFPALMPLSSTQIKKSKKWISMIMGVQMKRADGTFFNPASFSHAYRIGTVKEQNDQGSWYGVTVDAAGQVTDPSLYLAAKEMHEQFSKGQIKVAQPDDNVGASDEEGAQGGAGEKF